nr:unnamed protein product [Callosobruchus analis]
MESTNEKTRRSRGSGRFGDEQKRLRESGKAYKLRKLKPVPEKAAPSQQVCCKCQFACKSLGYHWRKSLFENFYKQNSHVQGSYLMKLTHLVPIRRRRHGSYENPEESKRQTTVNYTIPGESGDFVQVCKKTVMDTFAVTRKKIDGLVSKKKLRSVNSLPRDVGHYTRAKSDKEYLSPDLNLHRLFKAFIKLYPESVVTYKFYCAVFKDDFPKLSFRRPRMDTCHTCDRLDCEIRANNELSKAAKTKLAIHHAKAERTRDILKENTITSQQPGSDLCCLSKDLEQVLFVPILVHSDMFYLL